MIDKLFDFLISTLKVFQFWVVIYPDEKGVRMRLGKFESVLDTGFHWCFPFKVDSVLALKVVLRTLRLGAQSLVTSDDKPLIINTVVSCRISDVARAALEVQSVDHVVDDVCSGLVAAFVADNTFERLLRCCGEQDEELLSACQRRAAELGISILRVQFTDVSPSRTFRLLKSVSEASSYWNAEGGRSTRL